MEAPTGSNFGGLSIETLHLMPRGQHTRLLTVSFFLSLFLLPGIVTVILLLIKLRKFRSTAVPVGLITAVVYSICLLGAGWFIAACVLLHRISDTSSSTVPGEQYVAFSPSSGDRGTEAPVSNATSTPRSELLPLMFMFSQHSNKENAAEEFHSIIYLGGIQALLPVFVLAPVVLWQVWAPASCTPGRLPYRYRYPLHIEDLSRADLSALNAFKCIEDFVCACGCKYGLWVVACCGFCVPSKYRLQNPITIYFISVVPNLIRALSLSLVILVPLIYQHVREPAYDLLGSARGMHMLPECPPVQNITKHYQDSLLWPDMIVDEWTGIAGQYIHENSIVDRAFGTRDSVVAGRIAAGIKCSVLPDLHELDIPNIAQSIFPVERVLHCECTFEANLAHTSCPSVQQLFELLDQATRPRWEWKQPNEGEDICTTCKFEEKQRPERNAVWVSARRSMCVYLAFLLMHAAAIAFNSKAPRWPECCHCADESIFTLVTTSNALCFAMHPVLFAFQFVFISFVGVKHPQKGSIGQIGNLCITTAPNVYTQELSGFFLLSVTASVIFSVCLVHFSNDCKEFMRQDVVQDLPQFQQPANQLARLSSSTTTTDSSSDIDSAA